MDNLLSYKLYPETLDADLIVTSISTLNDLKQKFLFCLDNNLRGELSNIVKKAWPFTSLIFIDKKPHGVRQFLLIRSAPELNVFLETVSETVSKLGKNLKIIAIPGWSGCHLKENSYNNDTIKNIRQTNRADILLYLEEENE